MIIDKRLKQGGSFVDEGRISVSPSDDGLRSCHCRTKQTDVSHWKRLTEESSREIEYVV